MSIITIATDFGTVDGYAAAVKGVIKSITPEADMVDITHELEGIFKAALVLTRYYSSYPSGTVHLVVVDPTVGSPRSALIGYDGKYHFVGPDNGIFTRIAVGNQESKWWAIDSSRLPSPKCSNTFHGRDIFAPAAALLARGISRDEIGEKIDMPIQIQIPQPMVLDDGVWGEIIDIDRFGNLVTNIGSEIIKDGAAVALEDDVSIGLARTYSDVPKGEPLAYIGSLGYLEIGVNLGRADTYFSVGVGRKVRVIF